jgi:hypothetical protein
MATRFNPTEKKARCLLQIGWNLVVAGPFLVKHGSCTVYSIVVSRKPSEQKRWYLGLRLSMDRGTTGGQ